MKKIIHAQSGHTMFVRSISRDELPDVIKNGEYAKDYTRFYVVKNWDDDGHIFMYLGKGYKTAPKEIVVWYPKGEFWAAYGNSIIDAINGAQKDGWLYA